MFLIKIYRLKDIIILSCNNFFTKISSNKDKNKKELSSINIKKKSKILLYIWFTLKFMLNLYLFRSFKNLLNIIFQNLIFFKTFNNTFLFF